jgi:hypothetical protein
VIDSTLSKKLMISITSSDMIIAFTQKGLLPAYHGRRKMKGTLEQQMGYFKLVDLLIYGIHSLESAVRFNFPNRITHFVAVLRMS